MKKIHIGLAGVLVAIAILVSLLVHQRVQARLRETDVELRQQEEEIAVLITENQRLANMSAPESGAKIGMAREPAEANRELEELRAKLNALREQQNLLATQVAAARRAAGAQYYSVGDSNLLDQNREITVTFSGGPRAPGKLNDARAYAAALRKYASEHENEIPSSLDQITEHLPKPLDTDSPPWANAPITGTNSFELVYQGSLNDLSNIPPRRVALIREREPWQSSEGKWTRVYGYADGAAGMVESYDNFESWDAQHILPARR